MIAARGEKDFHVVKVALAVMAVLLFSQSPAIAQSPADCANALAVCSNGTINESSNGPGINDFAFSGNDP